MSEIRTYILDHYTVPDPDGDDVVFTRPLTVTVGSQALEPGVVAGKTLLRFAMTETNPLMERTPKMRVKILPRETSSDGTGKLVIINDPLFVELLFDNTSFFSEHKEMPLWLVDVLEFAAKTLRAQYELNQHGVVKETVD